MRAKKRRQSKRVLAAFLALAMGLSLTPGGLVAYAATDEHPEAVTITVVNEDGQAVQGASVAISVDSTSYGENYITDTKETDQYGVVEVMSGADFVEDEFSLSATVTADGYEAKELMDTPIVTAEDNFQVVLTGTTIDDVIITGQTLTYNGEPQELVSVTEVAGDIVTYEAVGDTSFELNEEGKPVAVNAGTYEIKVTVQRTGKEDLVLPVTAVIQRADIEGISIEGRSLVYNRKEQELVILKGDFQENDVVTWTVNSEELVSKEIPEAMAVGSYTVVLKVDRGPNYNTLVTEMVTTNLIEGELNLEGLTVTGLDGVYKVDDEGIPVAQPAVIVNNQGDYNLMYQLDDGDLEVNEEAWVKNTIPQVTNAGSYIVWVKAVKENYNDSDVEVIPAEGAIDPYNVHVAKAEQSFDFDKYDAHTSEDERESITINGAVPYKDVTYDFSATDIEALTGGSITYEVDAEEGIASIDNNGILTVYYPGDMTVIATLSGNENYSECVIEYHLSVNGEVSAQGNYISFPQQQVNYTLGTSDQISTQQAVKNDNRIRGDITYSMKAVAGVEINEQNGTLLVTDYNALATAIREADGALNITVTATKEKKGVYGQDMAEYMVTVSFENTPDVPYTLPKVNGGNGWYTTNVVVTPASGYSIAQSASGNFAETTTFGNQGAAARYVYLKNIETGGITDQILVDIKIDTYAPETDKMGIEISHLSIIEKIGLLFGFFNPSVTVEFTVEDELGADESGVDHLKWFYTKSDDATSSILADKSGTLEVTKEDGKYVASLTVTATEAEQFRGHIAFKAYDCAGNESAEVKEDNVVIVVDTINPSMDASFQLVDNGGVYNPVNRDGVVQHYFNGDVAFTFTVKEANFFSEDVEIGVTKDNETYDVDVEWTVDETNDEIHYGKFTLSGDGDYVVTMRYHDQSGNVMVDDDENEVELYTSEVITIDTTEPEIEFEYVHDGDIQKTIFTVEEHNFSADHVVVANSSTMQDVNGNPIAFTAEQLTAILQRATWTQNGDTYTFEYDQYVNGIYNLKLDYTDYAGWVAEPFTGDEFIIDHDGPTGVKIEYAKSPVDTFLETITLGFYNPSVTVRFTAYDTSSGVDSFTWGYTKETGASTIKHPEKLEDTTISAVRDQNDKSKFTAETTLTADELTQYRGYLSVVATDKFNNDSQKKVDDGNIIVVDTIAPEMTVEYTPADRTVSNTNQYYYNNDVDITFTVTEANFYPEDVNVSVTKDGKVFDYGTVNWGTRDANDRTVGTFTLQAPEDHSGDGDYVIAVEYTDRSNNEMVRYVSDVHTIDTVLPEIDVEYRNLSVVNTLKDGDGHSRRYFEDTQTAVVTIAEHNFYAEDVKYDIVARDVAGNQLQLNDLVTMSQWKSQGDVHSMTITYPGDANYTFDVAYADLATNEAVDYASDYFTVDRTKPENLRVEYSTSVLDTVLESMSFGFYNAKMTVTISADDAVSGVHSFLYSYLNAEGVSAVNAQLVNQAIAAADIRYSNDGVTATASFEIPKMVLAGDNQFNGTVEFTATDRSGVESEIHKETKRIVVDNISPTAQVSYNDPVSVEGNIAYYDGDIQATISIQEANFYAQDVQVSVSKDGGVATAVPTTWTDNSVDRHTGSFTLSGDGDYVVTISYRDKSSNQMETYTSQQMTIDTQIEAPTFSINGQTVGEKGGAYKNDATIAFGFEDVNFDSHTVQLTRTRFDSVEDVTAEFIQVGSTATGGSGSFSIPSEVGNDGIYTLTVGMTDKAMHTTQAQMKFTINRFGSVYEYDEYLMSLIQDGGQYITIQDGESTAITKNLVITEYNADQLLEGSLQILITRDGQTIEAEYTTDSTTVDGGTSVGESGWYEYIYTINASNFKEDGVYKISLSSAYATSDSEHNDSTSVPENSIDESGAQVMDTMSFTVDTTAPEIRNIVNLEKQIINAQTVNVKYTIVDVGGLKSIEVVLNGDVVDAIDEFDDGGFNYNGQFTIHESSNAQTVQLKVTDLAGNVTDTAAEDFNANGLFEFYDTITVSTNFFVRWYANKTLFWGSICGVIVVVGAICGIVATKHRKKAVSK